MSKKYVSYIPDEQGKLAFTNEEHDIWRRLYQQQMQVIPGRACAEYSKGLEILNLPVDKIPNPIDVSKTLKDCTDWIAQPVPAVIGASAFFTLLANRKFPAACFIRSEEDFLYIKEPDIFHEIYGHLPMLTNKHFADFVAAYGKFALECEKKHFKYLFRLFWFTVEFGLINTKDGMRIYGGGILSSIHETKTALDNPQVEYVNFDILRAFRTPYRIDIPQTLYFVIENFEQLFTALDQNMDKLLNEADNLGDLKPKFIPVDGKGDELEYTN